MMIWDTISWCLTIVVWCEIVHQPVNFASMGGNSKVPQTSWYDMGPRFRSHLRTFWCAESPYFTSTQYPDGVRSVGIQGLRICRSMLAEA